MLVKMATESVRKVNTMVRENPSTEPKLREEGELLENLIGKISQMILKIDFNDIPTSSREESDDVTPEHARDSGSKASPVQLEISDEDFQSCDDSVSSPSEMDSPKKA